MRLRLFSTALLLALGLSACGSQTGTTTSPTAAPTTQDANAYSVGSLQITDVWARPSTTMAGDSSEEPTAESGGMSMEPTAESGGMSMEPTAESGDMSMDMSSAVGAAYMTISNSSGTADKLIQASGDVADSIELHTMEMQDGVMVMRPVEGGIEVPANGEVQLKPGGFHVMLIGLKHDLKVGDTVALKLQFETAGSVDVTATVREP